MCHPPKERPESQPKTQGLRRWTTCHLRKDAYKLRNVVERSFNTLKQWRSLATRRDKLALTYRTATVLTPSSSGALYWGLAL
jgi:transposase